MSTLDAYSSQIYGDTLLPEVQKKNLWVLTFLDAYGGKSQDFPNHDMFITNTNLPLFNFETEKTNFDLILPQSKNNYGEVTFTFIETVGFSGFNYCYNWLTSIYDFDKRVYKKDFHSKKKNAIIKFIGMYPTTSLVSLIRTNKTDIMQNAQFNLLGMMIKGINDVDLDQDGDPLSFDITTEIQDVKYIEGNMKIM